jgi:hypothetical protein
VQREVGFGLNVGGTEFSVNNTPTILGFVGMSMKSHLWCYEILEHIKGVGGVVNTKVCVFKKKLCFELGLLQFASEYNLYHESVLIVLAIDFVAHDTSNLSTTSSPSNAMFVGHVIRSMAMNSLSKCCVEPNNIPFGWIS